MRRRSIRTTLVAGLVAAATIAGACGGDDGSASGGAAEPQPTTTVERDAWSDALDEACAELNRDYEQLAGAAPTSRDEAVAYAREVEAFAAAFVSAVAEAGTPSEGRADADALADLADELAAAASELAASAQDGDVAGVRRATAQLDSVGVEINAASDELDVPSCGGF